MKEKKVIITYNDGREIILTGEDAERAIKTLKRLDDINKKAIEDLKSHMEKLPNNRLLIEMNRTKKTKNKNEN